MFLNEVTVLVPVLNEAKHSFALYTPERTRQRWPVRLAAATEQDMNDWVSDRALEGLVRRNHRAFSVCPAVTSCVPMPAYPAQPVLLREPEGPRTPVPAGHLVCHLQG